MKLLMMMMMLLITSSSSVVPFFQCSQWWCIPGYIRQSQRDPWHCADRSFDPTSDLSPLTSRSSRHLQQSKANRCLTLSLKLIVCVSFLSPNSDDHLVENYKRTAGPQNLVGYRPTLKLLVSHNRPITYHKLQYLITWLIGYLEVTWSFAAWIPTITTFEFQKFRTGDSS